MHSKNLLQSILILPFLFLVSFTSKAQILSEGFEGAAFPPAGWLNNQIGGGADVWISATSTTQTNPNNVLPHTGFNMALYDAYNYAVLGEAAELVTPALNFSSGTYRVKFWMYRDTRYTLSNDSLEVFVNTTPTSVGGVKLGGIWRQIADPPVVAVAGWYQYSFDIPSGFNTATNYISFVGDSDYGTEMVIDDIVVEVQPSGCSGTPSAGIISGPAAACSGVNFTLTNTGATEATGINYSWQSSASAAGPWVNIPGQTNFAQASVVQTAATYYRFADTCTISNLTAISNVIQVTMTPASQCYCSPPAVTLHTIVNDYLTNVSILTTTLNSSNGTNLSTGYTLVLPTPSNNTGTIQQSASPTINVTLAAAPSLPAQVAVWVDFNKNGNFEASEYFLLTITGSTASGTLTVPANALLGQTGLRVRGRSVVFTSADACTAFLSGETEDYTITIAAPASCIQPSGLTAIPVSHVSDSIRWNKVASASGYEWAVTTSPIAPVSGTAAATNNDTAVLASGLTSATQYYAYVRSNCGAGNFSAWTSTPFISVRTNDLCSGATDVTAKIGINITDTAGKGTLATAGFEGSPANSPCSGTSTGGINDVWYKFTAPANGDSVIIAGAAGSSNDWVYQLFASCGTSQLACNDDAGAANPFGDQSMPVIGICGLTPGATYYVRAYPYSPGTAKTSVLYIYSGGTCPVPPANDECANAVDISASCGSPVSGTTVNASPSGNVPNSSCGNPFANQTDVWYKFNTGTAIILPYFRVTNIDTSASKTVYAAVYHGSDCSNLIYDGCLSVSPGSDSIIGYIQGVDANQNYYVRVYSIANEEQTSFNISICDSTSTLLVDTTGQSACNTWGSIAINAASQNNNRWVRIINSGLMAEINANGNDLGLTSISVYKNISGTVRRDATRALPLLGAEYMDRNITITPTSQPASPVKVRVYFTNAELNALVAVGGDGYADVTGISDIVVTKNEQACSPVFSAGNNDTLIVPTARNSFADGAYVEFNVPSFSTFFLHGGFAPLPVTFITFNAQRSGKINKLSWSTSQEINARYFVIERSNDALNYTPVGQVAASGTSSVNQSYYFTDNAPVKGINYYRLRIVDNGTSNSRYSVVRNVRNEGTADIAVYPNPAKDKMYLDITSDKADKATITISDLSGKLVYAKSVNVIEGPNSLKVATSGFTNGTYIIKIQLSEDIVVRKFNKL